MHEFVLSARTLKREHGITALDVAKRLMDFGFHPPTVYFPLVVPEALMIEPTETEAKETLDAFADAMLEIAREAARGARRRSARRRTADRSAGSTRRAPPSSSSCGTASQRADEKRRPTELMRIAAAHVGVGGVYTPYGGGLCSRSAGSSRARLTIKW